MGLGNLIKRVNRFFEGTAAGAATTQGSAPLSGQISPMGVKNVLGKIEETEQEQAHRRY